MNTFKVFAIGNLGKETATRAITLKNGQPGNIAENSLAVTLQKDETSWYSLAAFSPNAIKQMQKAKKGDQVVVTGVQRIESFTKKDGSVGVAVKIRVLELNVIKSSAQA